MSDFYYAELYAKFAGFRILVLANRLACNDDFSRGAHDKLVSRLDRLIVLMRRTIAAERELALNPDGPDADDLGEAIWCTGQQLTDYWSDADGIDLLHNDVHIDWSTKEWYDARTGSWHFLDNFPLPRVEVGDDRLHGLCEIVRRIDAETGIRFNTYTTDPKFMAEEELDERPEGDYERLHGPDW